MAANNLPTVVASFELRNELSRAPMLDDISNATSWETAERLCLRALPSCEIYSVRPTDCGWTVEIEYDNLLHEGVGPRQVAALSNALRGILETLEFTRAC